MRLSQFTSTRDVAATPDSPARYTVEHHGTEYQVSLTSFGAVLHAQGVEEVAAHSASVVEDSTGISAETLEGWVVDEVIDGFWMYGACFIVPDEHGRYPVLDPGAELRRAQQERRADRDRSGDGDETQD